MWRVRVALVVLALYVIVPGVLGWFRSQEEEALLPPGSAALLRVCALELTVFAVLLAAVVRTGQVSRVDLLLRWRGGWWVLPRAAGWSVVLRLGVGLALGAALVGWQAVRGTPLDSLEDLRPRVEAMVDVEALRDPVYLALMLTVVSFVLAGLREELWRVGMVSLLGRAFPGLFAGRFGPWLALVPTALIFGMAHIAQGGFGVAATALLGLGLGAVMLWHRSLWDAVFAHGFFNATTFGMLVLLADHLPGAAGR
jgi:membrane protease YdiL (CAAX protease family)